MKFTEKLASHLTPEWRHQYIDYAGLKAMILQAANQVQMEDNKRTRDAIIVSFDQTFFNECQNELKKVSNFYTEKLAEAQRCYNDMMARVRQYMNANLGHGSTGTPISLERHLPKPKRKQLKLAFSELYLSFILLQNYQSLNYTGFKKICKKHDKILYKNTGQVWFQQHVETAPFYTSKEVLALIKESEEFFTNNLEGGNRAEAMKRLRVPPMMEKQLPSTTFFLGLCLGLLLSLCVVAVFVILSNPHIDKLLILHLYRGPMLFILLLFLIGVNILGWRAAGVNHILIFEINPRRHLRATEVMLIAAVLALFWILSLLGFLYYEYLQVPPMVFPLALMVIILVILFNPLPLLYRNSRFWFIKVLGRVISAPFFHVEFADFFLGDQLNSLVVGLTDMLFLLKIYLKDVDFHKQVYEKEYSLTDFVLEAILRSLPPWFRLAQCIRRFVDTKKGHPFLTNAAKYATSFPVIFCTIKMRQNKSFYSSYYENPYVWGFFICMTFSSVYCLTWDMLRDFGVFKKFKGKNFLLRDQIIYPKYVYYIAIVENFILRFAWIFFFTLEHNTTIHSDILTTISTILEVFRRYVWNYFRLEHEHLYNEGQFRAVRDISVPILDEAESQLLVENQSFHLITPE